MSTYQTILSDFGDYIQANTGSAIRDISELPHPKEKILEAILDALSKERDAKMIDAIIIAAYMLPDFQENVGSKPIILLGVTEEDMKLATSGSDEDITKLANKICDNPDIERYEFFSKLVQEDLQRIKSKVEEALVVRSKLQTKQNEYKAIRDVAVKSAPTMMAGTKLIVVRPWVRYWARTLDIVYFGIVCSILVFFFDQHTFKKMIGESQDAAIILIVLLWAFVEPISLMVFGTTPGKWVLKTTLRKDSGEAFTYAEGLSRSLKVWFRGQGIYFPIVMLITNCIAYTKLRKNGITSWDKEGNLVVEHEKIGVLRGLIALASPFVFLFSLVAVFIPFK